MSDRSRTVVTMTRGGASITALVGGAFARYRAYLESVRGELPTGAYILATSDWCFDANDHRSPHDAWLERMSWRSGPRAAQTPRRSASRCACSPHIMTAGSTS